MMHTLLTKGDVLYAFGAYLDELGVPYVIVGDTSRYPDEINSDVDIVFPASKVQQCGQIIQRFADQVDPCPLAINFYPELYPGINLPD